MMLVISLLAVGGTPVPSDPWTILLGSLGGMGIVGFGFILMLKHMLQSQTTTAVELSNAIHTNSLLLLQLQKELLRHDATVRGVNPSAGADHDERMVRALAVYEQMQAEIDRTASVIQNKMNGRT